MIFVIDNQGTTKVVLYEPIYQGSNNANQIVLLAPFASSTQPTVSFTLPNGIQTEPFYMTPLQEWSQETGELVALNNLNGWAMNVDFAITEFAGIVDVQFELHIPNGTLATYTSAFEVGKGVYGIAPNIDTTGNIYNQILSYLSTIVQDTNEAVDKAIAYIRYIAPSKDLLKPPNNNYLTAIPAINSDGDIAYKGNFTVDGMTAYLDKSNLIEPNDVINRDLLFYQNRTPATEAGFIIDLGSIESVGVVQAYYFQIQKVGNTQYADGPTIVCYISEDGQTYTEADSVTLNSAYYCYIHQFQVNQQTRYIKLVQQDNYYTNGSLSYKGIEVYQATKDGAYEIVRNDGNTSIIPTYDVDNYISILEPLRDEAQTSAENAQKWATGSETETDEQHNNSAKDWANKSQALYNDIDAKKGQVNGYAPLEHIEGEEYPKIPSMYINQIDIKEYKKITDEAQLNTIVAQKHDVAVLVEPEYIADDEGNLVATGELVITKSWLLYNVAEDGTREWIKYGLSYATNAGYSTYANNAGNTRAINGTVIESKSYADYNAMVENGTVSTDTIYIVEV